MKRQLLPVILLLLSSSAVAKPPPFQRKVLPNGLEVIVAERHAAPLVTVELAVHNGAMNEPPEYSGLSHLYEHMIFKGNKAFPDEIAVLDRARELGTTWNGLTQDNRVDYFYSSTSDHAAEVMVFLRDAAVSPLFDPKQLERERVVVTGEMDRNESEPIYLLWRAIESRVFWKYPTRKNALGSRKTVLATTPAMMHTLQQRYYVPNNSVIIVTGDVKADEVFKQAEEIYGGWAKAPDPFVKYPVPRHPPIPRSDVVLVTQPVQTFTGMIDWLGPSTLDKSAPYSYTAIFLAVLVNSPASRFQKDLVDSGACTNVGMVYESARDDGYFSIGFDASEEKAATCAAAVFAELPRLAEVGYFTDEELKNAAHSLDVWMAHERETNDGWAHQISYWWAVADLAYYDGYIEHMQAQKQADVAAFLKAYLLGKPFIFGALESPTLTKTLDKPRLETLAGLGGKKKEGAK